MKIQTQTQPQKYHQQRSEVLNKSRLLYPVRVKNVRFVSQRQCESLKMNLRMYFSNSVKDLTKTFPRPRLHKENHLHKDLPPETIHIQGFGREVSTKATWSTGGSPKQVTVLCTIFARNLNRKTVFLKLNRERCYLSPSLRSILLLYKLIVASFTLGQFCKFSTPYVTKAIQKSQQFRTYCHHERTSVPICKF